MTVPPRPIQIAAVPIPHMDGIIGISACPGYRDESGCLDLYEELLLNDLTSISNWGAAALVTLLDNLELRNLGVRDLPNTVDWLNLLWFHLPIDNGGIPGKDFELLWSPIGSQLCQLLREGKRIVIHCKEGIGRSGLIAARLLIQLGVPPEQAIKLVQKARPESLQLYSQEKYCYSLSV
ncbi:MAG: hypothetical protein E4G89_03305 [Methanothrix sp.]|nr:MAG: hypothetical protein E4G89_03305 [Methanothrix sp.]